VVTPQWAPNKPCPLFPNSPNDQKVIMRSIIIVVARQAGLQLGIGLLDARYRVTIASNRSPDQIRSATHLVLGAVALKSRSSKSGGVPPTFRTADQIRSDPERGKGIGEEISEFQSGVS